jgi:hypothetical protein
LAWLCATMQMRGLERRSASSLARRSSPWRPSGGTSSCWTLSASKALPRARCQTACAILRRSGRGAAAGSRACHACTTRGAWHICTSSRAGKTCCCRSGCSTATRTENPGWHLHRSHWWAVVRQQSVHSSRAARESGRVSSRAADLDRPLPLEVFRLLLRATTTSRCHALQSVGLLWPSCSQDCRHCCGHEAGSKCLSSGCLDLWTDAARSCPRLEAALEHKELHNSTHAKIETACDVLLTGSAGDWAHTCACLSMQSSVPSHACSCCRTHVQYIARP